MRTSYQNNIFHWYEIIEVDSRLYRRVGKHNATDELVEKPTV